MLVLQLETALLRRETPRVIAWRRACCCASDRRSRFVRMPIPNNRRATDARSRSSRVVGAGKTLYESFWSVFPCLAINSKLATVGRCWTGHGRAPFWMRGRHPIRREEGGMSSVFAARSSLLSFSCFACRARERGFFVWSSWNPVSRYSFTNMTSETVTEKAMRLGLNSF